MKTQTAIFIDYQELETIINEHFGIEYSMVADNEWRNDVSYTLDTDMLDAPDWYDIERIVPLLAGTNSATCYALDTLMAILVLEEKIEKGLYVINVCW